MANQMAVIAVGTKIPPPKPAIMSEVWQVEANIPRSPLWDVEYKSFWTLDNVGRQMVDVPLEFYFNMPLEAKCLFSTNGGSLPKKTVDPANPRQVSLWLGLKVCYIASTVRRNFTRLSRDIKPPTVWTDLYEYFDAYDLWNNGIFNCWNVITLMAEENRQTEEEILEEKLIVVDDWIEKWMSAEGNPARLDGWAQGTDVLLALHPGDFGCGGVAQLDAQGLEMLRDRLVIHYHRRLKLKRESHVQTWLSTFPFLDLLLVSTLISCQRYHENEFVEFVARP